MKSADTYCPFSGFSCQKNCAFFDIHFEDCLCAMTLSSIGAYIRRELAQNLDILGTEEDTRMNMSKRIVGQGRNSIVDDATPKEEPWYLSTDQDDGLFSGDISLGDAQFSFEDETAARVVEVVNARSRTHHLEVIEKDGREMIKIQRWHPTVEVVNG